MYVNRCALSIALTSVVRFRKRTLLGPPPTFDLDQRCHALHTATALRMRASRSAFLRGRPLAVFQRGAALLCPPLDHSAGREYKHNAQWDALCMPAAGAWSCPPYTTQPPGAIGDKQGRPCHAWRWRHWLLPLLSCRCHCHCRCAPSHRRRGCSSSWPRAVGEVIVRSPTAPACRRWVTLLAGGHWRVGGEGGCGADAGRWGGGEEGSRGAHRERTRAVPGRRPPKGLPQTSGQWVHAW